MEFNNINIVVIKDEYTTFLVNILTPFIYEGLLSIYNTSITAHSKLINDNNICNKSIPSFLQLFQTCLKDIQYLNNTSIVKQVERIKTNCECTEWIDSLFKSVIKSNIMLLTFSNYIDKINY